jgi:hypothetical protein
MVPSTVTELPWIITVPLERMLPRTSMPEPLSATPVAHVASPSASST